jgi:hypothetical protein
MSFSIATRSLFIAAVSVSDSACFPRESATIQSISGFDWLPSAFQFSNTLPSEFSMISHSTFSGFLSFAMRAMISV